MTPLHVLYQLTHPAPSIPEQTHSHTHTHTYTHTHPHTHTHTHTRTHTHTHMYAGSGRGPTHCVCRHHHLLCWHGDLRPLPLSPRQPPRAEEAQTAESVSQIDEWTKVAECFFLLKKFWAKFAFAVNTSTAFLKCNVLENLKSKNLLMLDQR